eukprot:g80532.t1
MDGSVFKDVKEKSKVTDITSSSSASFKLLKAIFSASSRNRKRNWKEGQKKRNFFELENQLQMDTNASTKSPSAAKSAKPATQQQPPPASSTTRAPPSSLPPPQSLASPLQAAKSNMSKPFSQRLAPENDNSQVSHHHPSLASPKMHAKPPDVSHNTDKSVSFPNRIAFFLVLTCDRIRFHSRFPQFLPKETNLKTRSSYLFEVRYRTL